MGIKRDIAVTIKCDYPDCDRTFTGNDSQDAVVKLARREGWTLSPSYKLARCPDHRALVLNRPESTTDKILELRKANPEMSGAEIAREVNVSESWVSFVLLRDKRRNSL